MNKCDLCHTKGVPTTEINGKSVCGDCIHKGVTSSPNEVSPPIQTNQPSKMPVMYVFVNKGLGMSIGKVAAQAAHAAVQAYQTSRPEMIDAWNLGGHYTKLVMEARDTQHLQTIAAYLQERGFKTSFIIDEGRNEVAPHSFTALGVEIVDKADSHVAATFSSFQLYRDKIRIVLEADK